LGVLKDGDKRVVGRLDRLDAHLVTLIEYLRGRRVRFRSINDGVIDATSASGELVFHIFDAPLNLPEKLPDEWELDGKTLTVRYW
jgi:hypothetical protein